MRGVLALACAALLASACGGPPQPPTEGEPPSASTSALQPTAMPAASEPSWSPGDPAEPAAYDREFVVAVSTGAIFEVDGDILGWTDNGEALIGTTTGTWVGAPGEALRRVTSTPEPTQPAIIPNVFVAGDGRRSVEEPTNELRLRSSSNPHGVVITTFTEHFIDFVNVSPDEKLATVHYYDGSPNGAGFYVVDVAQRRKHARVTGAYTSTWIDATHVLYTANACGSGEPPVLSGERAPFVPAADIAILDVTTLESSVVAGTDLVEQDGRLSPDHTTVAFLERADAHSPTGSALAVVDIASGVRRRLVETDALLLGIYAASNDVWSPDGRYIAFATAGRGTYLHGLCQDVWPVTTSTEVFD